MSTISRRRMLQSLGVAGLSVAGLAGCGPAQGDPPRQSGRALMQLWTHDPGYATFFQDAVSNPQLMKGSSWDFGIDLTMTAQEDIMTRLVTQSVAGRPLPNLAGIDVGQFPRSMRADIAEHLFVDLTEIIEPYGDDLLRTEPYMLDDRAYALESDGNVSVMYYRQDVFKELGIAEDVETWEEMLEIGADVAESTGQAIGMTSNNDQGAIVEQTFGQMLLQRGGRFYDDDGELALVSEEAVEVLEMLAEGVASGAFLSVSDPYGGAVGAALNDNRLIACVMPNWYETYGLEANVPEQAGLWRARTIPRFSSGGHISTTAGGTGFAVLRDQELTDASLDFLQRTYLSSEGQLARYHAGGFLPTLVELYDSPEFQEITSDFLGGQRIMDVFGVAAADLPSFRLSPNWLEMREAFAGYLLNAIRGQMAPEDALQAGADLYHRRVQ